MKQVLFISLLLFALHSPAQNSFTPADFIKAKQNPEWVFKPGFNSDSTLYTDLTFHQTDSLLALYEERVKSVKDLYYTIYLLSAKTGKIVREENTNIEYDFSLDSLMLGRLDSLVLLKNTYTGATRWELDVDKITATDNPAVKVFYFINQTRIRHGLLYISLLPGYIVQPQGKGKPKRAMIPETDANFKKWSKTLVVDLVTGKVLYKRPFPFRFFLRSYGDTIVEDNFRLTCLNIKTNKKLWSKKFDLPAADPHTDSSFYFPIESGPKAQLLLLKFINAGKDKPDSTFIVSVNYKNGKELKKMFITASEYESARVNTDDTSTYFCWNDSLTAFDVQTMKKKWSITSTQLKKCGLHAIDDMGDVLRTDSLHVFIADSTSTIICISKDSGKIEWVKNYSHHVNFPAFDFFLTRDFTILTLQDYDKNGYVTYNETYVSDKTNHSNIANDGTSFSVLGEDAKTGEVYIYEDKSNKVKKIKIR